MLFLFDILPLEDIIHETIIPMLDYESRIVLNRCFAPTDRYIQRFPKDEIIRHELYNISMFIKSKLDNIENVSGPTRSVRMKKKSQLLIKFLHCFEPGNRILLIMHCYPRFHEIAIGKFTNLSDPNSIDLNHASRYFRKKIGELATKILPPIKSIVPTTEPIGTTLNPIVVKGF